jgi:diguanylate cyclase (GGDEF)-like protein
MPQLNEHDTKFIQHYIHWFKEKFTEEIRNVISGEVTDTMPPDLIEVEQQVHKLHEAFTLNGPITVGLPEHLIPIFKRMMIEIRRTNIPDIERGQEATHHPFLLKTLDEKQRPIDELMEQKWLRDVSATRIPPITEYISLKRIEETRRAVPIQMQAREYDQKFRILQAPALIFADLKFYRERGRQRSTPVTVAFLDIDNFKKNFNSQYDEVEIDRRVLPRIMSTIEAHMFDHGFAYRHGGDEFVLIIPNMAFEIVSIFLDKLRRSIEALEFHGIESHATISTGFVFVDDDCFLTEREIVKRANEAKKYAKGGKKNRIATFGGTHYDPKELYVVTPRYPLKSKRTPKSEMPNES